MLVSTLLLVLLASAGRAHAAPTFDPSVGLHGAEAAPPTLPPGFAFSADQLARLAGGEAVWAWSKDGRHEQVVAAVRTKMNRWQLWSTLQSVQDYGELVPLEWARLESSKDTDGARTLVVRFKVDVPLIAGELSIASTFSGDGAYTAFQMLDDKRGVPIAHAVGYWEVSDVEGDLRQLVLRLDFDASLPLPRETLAEGLGTFVTNVARETESRVYDQERALRDVW